jgi:hypothetical protein
MRKPLAHDRQGLQRQLVEASDFDGWPAGATGGSYWRTLPEKEPAKQLKRKARPPAKRNH